MSPVQIAITRKPSRRMQSGERTFVGRELIGSAKAASQHAAYCEALAACGLEVRTLEPDDSFPDCAFVEDCAVVLCGAALICRPGAASRQGEVDAIAQALSGFQDMVRAQSPATIEGGDVLRFGNRILIGRSSRTNETGIGQFRRFAEPLGYTVTECLVKGCLHLKTACAFLPDGSLLANHRWIDLPNDIPRVAVADDEPWAGNILRINQTIITASNQPKTNLLLRQRGFNVIEVDISEFQKAEGGVTCLSILIGAT